MPRREPTDASVRAARTLFIHPINAVDAAQASDTVGTIYYNDVVEMMPLGFRGSFLKFIGFPASWATAYGLSPAQVSQDRYSADVASIWRGVRSEDISAEQKLALTTLLIRSYIIAAPSVMDMSVFPEFRRPRWMAAQQRDFLVNAISGAYAQRAQTDQFDNSVEEAPAMSREEQLRAGAEPTTAEEMAFEMGGEGVAREPEEMSEEEVDDIRDQFEAPDMRTVGSGNTTTEVIPEAYVKRLVNLQDGEQGARAVVDIINDDVTDEASDAILALERSVRSGLMVRWPEGTSSARLVRNSAAFVYKYGESLDSRLDGLPKVIMVVAKMICPEEDVDICPLATATASNVMFTGPTGRYAYFKNFENRYWNAGFGEEGSRYTASMYKVVVFKLSVGAVDSAKQQNINVQATYWLERYKDYLQTALALQANLPEEAPTFAGTATAEPSEESEADVQLQREIREQITLPRGIDSPMDDAVYSAIYILIKLGYDRSAVSFAVRSLIGNYNLVPFVVEPPQSAQERRLYSETRVPFLRLGLIEASMGQGRSFGSQKALYYARTISGSAMAAETLSSQYRMQRFTNTQRARTRPLRGVLGVPLPANISNLSVDQLGALILRLREQTLATASRMTAVEPTAAETTTATQEVPTSMQIADLSDMLRNRMRRGGLEYRIVAFQVAGSHGALYGESHRLRTEVPIVMGPAADDMNYIFYLASPNVGMEGYRAVQFWQLSFGQIPYDIAEGGKVTNMTFVRRILNFLSESGRLSQPGMVRLEEPTVETKRALRKFLADPTRLVFFLPIYRGVSDNVLNTNVPLNEITATSETLLTMMSQLFAMVRDRNMAEANSRQQQASSQEPSRLTITANQRDEGVEQPESSSASASTPSSGVPLLSSTQMQEVSKNWYKFAFGIELEGFDRYNSRLDFTKGMRSRGVNIYCTDAYKSSRPARGEDQFVNPNAFRVEADTSVAGADARSGSSDYEGRLNTMEIVSPILNKSNDYKSGTKEWVPLLENFLEAAEQEGFYIDPSAGLHIHVGYKNFDRRQTKNVLINSILMFPVLQALVSEAWQGRFYASNPTGTGNDMLSNLQDVNNATSTNEAGRIFAQKFTSGRYSWLNLTNFPNSSRTPTFEYRFQASTIERDTFINTIKILQCIWQASLKGIIPIKEGQGKEQDQVVIEVLGEQLFTFARNRYAETMLRRVSPGDSSRDVAFRGFDYYVNAKDI